jgi:hypothetical protein
MINYTINDCVRTNTPATPPKRGFDNSNTSIGIMYLIISVSIISLAIYYKNSFELSINQDSITFIKIFTYIIGILILIGIFNSLSTEGII